MATTRGSALVLIAVAVAIAAGGYYFLKGRGAGPSTPQADISVAMIPVGDEYVASYIRHDFPKLVVYDNAVSKEEHLANFQPYATARGLTQIRNMLDARKWFVGAEKIDMRFIEAPAVIRLPDRDGRPYWQATARIEVDASGGGARETKPYDAVMAVTTITLNGEQALGIDEMSLLPAQ